MRPTLLLARSRGTLSLRSSDPLQPPRIVANYFGDARDLRVLVEAHRLAARLVRQPAARRWRLRLDTTPVRGCERLRFGSRKYWR